MHGIWIGPVKLRRLPKIFTISGYVLRSVSLANMGDDTYDDQYL